MLSESLWNIRIGGRILNLGWTQLEFTSKIMKVRIENHGCGVWVGLFLYFKQFSFLMIYFTTS